MYVVSLSRQSFLSDVSGLNSPSQHGCRERTQLSVRLAPAYHEWVSYRPSLILSIEKPSEIGYYFYFIDEEADSGR